MQMSRDQRVIQSLDDFIEESGHDKALGHRNRNASGAKIEKLVLLDLTGSGAMSAADVIRQNFETGHRVRFGIVAQEKVPHLLISIRKMRMLLNPDESTKGAARATVERVLVKQVTRSVG